MTVPDYKKIVMLANEAKPEVRPPRVRRLLSLTDERYRVFQSICARRNMSASEVVDSLIAAYIYVDRMENQQEPAAAPLSATKQAP